MKRRSVFFAVLLIVVLMLFSACASPEKPFSSDKSYEQAAAGYTFADGLSETDLPRPAREIGSFSELVYAADYLAFYRISEAVAFDVSEEYAKTFYNVYQECMRAIGVSDLAALYPVKVIDEDYYTHRIVALDFQCRDFADRPPRETSVSGTVIKPFGYLYYRERADDFEDFPLALKNRGEVTVENSEQLWYAAGKGYLPVPAAGSTAQTLLADAKEVLRTIVYDGMTDTEKLKAIYAFLSVDVLYDYETYGAGDMPDSIRDQCFFLEGVFSNRRAVCDGKAKAYCLLAALEGIPCVRVTDVDRDFSAHAYNYVMAEGKWYLSCTTNGASVAEFETDGGTIRAIVPDYGMFLTDLCTPFGERWTYRSEMYPEIAAQIREPYDYWGETKTADGKSLRISSAKEAIDFSVAAEKTHGSLKNRQIEFWAEKTVTPESLREAFKDLFPQYAVQVWRMFDGLPVFACTFL